MSNWNYRQGNFGKIVTSVLDELIIPLIVIFLGSSVFKGLNLKIGSLVNGYGEVIQAIFDFVTIEIVVYFQLTAAN